MRDRDLLNKSYWVYILLCENGAYYTGYTTDLKRRFAEHLAGTARCKYTRSFRPVKIAQSWQIDDLKKAQHLERFIKKLTKGDKEKLILSPELLPVKDDYLLLKLVLASSSSARKMLLEKLQIPFECIAANINETPLENENPHELVKRLAKEKAEAVANQFTDALIIGADTIGILNSEILCKPLTVENAIKQLTDLSGNTVTFLTGICVLNTKTKEVHTDIDRVDVVFKILSREKILNYLKKERALDCAGSLKIEGFGITLVEKISGNDYTALIGLPMIKLIKIFETMEYLL